jgi:regulator of sigma E protease
VAIEGVKFQKLSEFRTLLEANAGKETQIGLFDLESHTHRQITVRLSEDKESLLGVSISPPQYSYYIIDYPQNILSAVAHTYNVAAYQFPALFSLISRSVAESDPSYAAQSVGGVVSVSAVVNELVIAKQFMQLINLTALISVSLATVNILPLPVLDGGQLLLAIIEKIKGSKFGLKTVERINMISFGFIILLFVSITLKDLVQFQIFTQIGDFIRKVLSL